MVRDSLAVVNIGRLLTMVPCGDDRLGALERAAVLCTHGRITFVGEQADLPAPPAAQLEVIDAGGRLVTPGLIEPHAHPIFAGDRAGEFEQRAGGATYEAIQRAGGGILATVRATNAASDEALVESTRVRLGRLLSHGVTLCEAKSGYALSPEGEVRLLRLLRIAGGGSNVVLSPTLLAHVVPPGVEREAYLDRFVDELIPQVAALDIRAGVPLAEAVDVFCDRGAFTLEETRRILVSARDAGLRTRVHAEQLSHTGAARLAAELGAASVEHLEHLAEADIARLAAAGTVCTLLPGAALSLRLPFPDARRLLDGGCAVALGTDLNPGSSYTENLPLMMSLACTQMGMTVEEAWRAVTVTAARAVGRPEAGRLQPGARADLVVWNEDDHRALVQRLGMARAERVIVAGRPVLPT